MENDILDSLDDLGYTGPLCDETHLNKSIEEGSTNVEFTNLVEWLVSQLVDLYSLENKVVAITGPDDAETFLMELSGFLREFGCPYKGLTDGPITQRLATRENKLRLLDYLITELQASRMLAVNKPNEVNITNTEAVQVNESEVAKHLKMLLVALGFPKPPEGITAFQLFSKVENKVHELAAKLPPVHLGSPLLKARLSDKQWEQVLFIQQALHQEYECRRQMVLKRLDVTIQSFTWSDRLKNKDDKFTAVYQPLRRNLTAKSGIGLAHLLAARDSLLTIDKTSNEELRQRTRCEINRVLIGQVPDRGGRVDELEPPPPEMPSFMQRSNNPPPQQQRQDDRRGGRGRGGYDNAHSFHSDRPPRGGGGRGGGDNRPMTAPHGGGWGANAPSYQPIVQDTGAQFFGGGGGYQPAFTQQPQYHQGQTGGVDSQGYYGGGGGGYENRGGGGRGGGRGRSGRGGRGRY